MPEITVTDLDNDVSSDDEIVESDSLNHNVYSFAEPFYNGTWNNVPTGVDGEQTFTDVVDYVNQFRDVWEAMSTMRAKIDAAIWDAQDNGQLKNVESIRTRRSADAKTPGRKPVVKSLRDQLLKNK